MENHTTAHRLQNVSLVFFTLLSAIWIFSWLSLANNIFPEITKMIFMYADLPVYFSGLTFVAATIIVRLDLTGPSDRHTTLAISFVVAAILAGLTILDLFAA